MEIMNVLGGTHGFIFIITALIVLYADYRGFNYFRGGEKILPKRFLFWTHYLVWAGLVLMIITGIMLTLPAWEFRLLQPIFYVKMGFVLVLIINAIAIGKLSKKAITTPFADLSKQEKITLMSSGGLSTLGWIGAAVIGYFIL